MATSVQTVDLQLELLAAALVTVPLDTVVQTAFWLTHVARGLMGTPAKTVG
jgi:hypothetical protein